ncbi:hypothetical protein [Thermomonas brevis]
MPRPGIQLNELLAVTAAPENEMSGIRLAEELGGICEVKGCANMTTRIVYSRYRGAVILCCDAHAHIVLDVDNPECHAICPNCGCEMPVN